MASLAEKILAIGRTNPIEKMGSLAQRILGQSGTGGDLLTPYAKQQAEARSLPIPQRASNTGAFIPNSFLETRNKIAGSIAPSREQIVNQIQEERQQSLVPEYANQLARRKEMIDYGSIRIGDTGPLTSIELTGGLRKVTGKVAQEAAKKALPALKQFQGYDDLTTKFLNYAKGKTTLSRQEILDFAKRPELKKGEADLLNRLGNEVKTGKISAQEFADSMRRDLLELKPMKAGSPQYRNITIDDAQGRDALDPMEKKAGKNYEEVVFESPITTNGSSHFPNSKNYFAHARGDEVVESGKKIWREQEIQSDAIQKEGLERMKELQGYDLTRQQFESVMTLSDIKAYQNAYQTNKLNSSPKYVEEARKTINKLEEKYKDILQGKRNADVEKLSPFTNDRFGERIMRERIREKAQKGYSKYRLPTPDTLGKIEGFDGMSTFKYVSENKYGIREVGDFVNPMELKKGQTIYRDGFGDWIVTETPKDGVLKAINKKNLVDDMKFRFKGQISESDILNYIKTCL